MAGFDVSKSPEWALAIKALRVIDKSFASAIRKYTKAVAEPEWLKAIRSRATTTLQQRVVASTATVVVSQARVRVRAAHKGRPLSGGLTMSQAAAPVEFGSNRYKQFGPRSRTGKTFFPAAREMAPRIASLFVQTVIKTTVLSLEVKES